MSETRYEFVRQFDLLSNSLLGWSTELNLLSLSDRESGEIKSAVTRVEALQGMHVSGLLESLSAESFGGSLGFKL